MRKKAQRFIRSIEQIKLGFWGWILTAAAVFYTRLLAESVLVGTAPGHQVIGFVRRQYDSMLRFVEYPLFFAANLLAIILLLRLFTRERIENISKTAIAFTPILWFLPAFDFIRTRGVGCIMKYAFDLKKVIYFFFNWLNPGAKIAWLSTGVRIECFLMLVLIGIYVWIKTGSSVKSIGGFIGGYFMFSFLTHGLPVFSAYVLNFLPLANPLKKSVYERVIDSRDDFLYNADARTALLWLVVIVLFSGLWFWIYDKEKLRTILKNRRPYRSFYYLSLLLGGVGAGWQVCKKSWFYPFQFPFDWVAVVGLGLALFFAFQFAIVVNDFSDKEIDAVSNLDRPLIRGKISEKEYKIIGGVFLLFSLYFAFSVSYWSFLLVVFFIAGYYIYSMPPLRIKRVFPFSSLLIATEGLVAMLVGFSLLSRSAVNFHKFPPRYAGALLTSLFLAVNIKDIKDIKGDRKAGIKTIPTIFGEETGRKIIAGLVLIAILLVPFMLGIRALILPSVVFGGLGFFIVLKKKWQEKLFFLDCYVYFIFVFILVGRSGIIR